MNRRSFFARLLGIAAIPVVGKVAAVLPASECVTIRTPLPDGVVLFNSLVRSDLEDGFYGLKRATFDGVSYGVIAIHADQEALNLWYSRALNRLATRRINLHSPSRAGITEKF
jgi:hypothetical protein